ncbi:hypothetical protein KJ855_04645 [Patescibacteria group bacterium]|nr:hypothetical protein [Patescibacteria group bacterium]
MVQNLDQPEKTAEEFDDSLVFEWESNEFDYHEKGKNWTYTLIVIAVVLIVLFVFMSNWLGIVIVVLLAVVVYQYAFKKPRMMHYILSREGLLVGEKLYTFKDIKSFWITFDGVLYVNTRQYVPPRLTVGLESVDVVALEKFLGNYVTRLDRGTVDSSDQISRWLKL